MFISQKREKFIFILLLAISAWEKANKRFTLPLVYYGSKSQLTFHYGSVSYVFFFLYFISFWFVCNNSYVALAAAAAAGNLMI